MSRFGDAGSGSDNDSSSGDSLSTRGTSTDTSGDEGAVGPVLISAGVAVNCATPPATASGLRRNFSSKLTVIDILFFPFFI